MPTSSSSSDSSLVSSISSKGSLTTYFENIVFEKMNDIKNNEEDSSIQKLIILHVFLLSDFVNKDFNIQTKSYSESDIMNAIFARTGIHPLCQKMTYLNPIDNIVYISSYKPEKRILRFRCP
jgi:hypothetical protein